MPIETVTAVLREVSLEIQTLLIEYLNPAKV